MKRLLPSFVLALLGFGALAGVSASQQFDQDMQSLQREWALIQVEPTPKHAEALRELAAKAGRLASQYPDKVEPRIWEGIILSSYAQVSGRYQRAESLDEIVARIKASQRIARSGNDQI